MPTLESLIDKVKAAVTPEVTACPACKAEFPKKQLKKAGMICPACGKYLRMDARSRIAATVDAGSFTELCRGLESRDFFSFPGYAEKLDRAHKSTGEEEAVICGSAKIGGEDCAVFVMDANFIMASMAASSAKSSPACLNTQRSMRFPSSALPLPAAQECRKVLSP